MDRVHTRNLRRRDHRRHVQVALRRPRRPDADRLVGKAHVQAVAVRLAVDRKSTRLNSSHRCISYAVFCLKKKMQSAGDEAGSSGASRKVKATKPSWVT